jgi:hypothetical protein
MENRRVASSADIEPSASDLSPQKEKKKKQGKKHWHCQWQLKKFIE